MRIIDKLRTSRNIRKLLMTALLIAVMSSLLTISASAIVFNDTVGHWAEVPIDRWTNNGVLDGYSGAEFRPDTFIKRGELFKMVSTVMQYQKIAGNPFSDLNTGDWYYDHVLKLVSAGVLNGSDGRVFAEDYITREQAFSLLARVFQIPLYEEGINSYPDGKDVSYWARGQVGGLARGGYIRGSSGLIRPLSNITRGEIVQLFDNIVKEYIYTANTYTDDINGFVIVSTEDVILRDMAIVGNLYITPGVKQGKVSLENVKINGDIYILGGGQNSILLRGSTRANNVYAKVDSVNGPVRVAISAPAEINMISVGAESENVIIEGIIRRAEISRDAKATLNNATIDEFYIEGEGSEVRMNDNSRVKTFIANSPRSALYAAGSIDKVLINASAVGTRIDTGKTAVITEVETWADDVYILGIGRVDFANVMDGDNVRITVPGTIVTVWPEAGQVITGDGPNDFIKPGESGTVGQPGMENALNVRRVTLLDNTRIMVEFSKEPDTVKGITPGNYVISGDAINFTASGSIFPSYVEISGSTATLTYTGANFSGLVPNQTVIITVDGFLAMDGSPLGVRSGLYRVPSDDARLISGSLSQIPILGTNWEGNSIGDGGTPLEVTIPLRLSRNTELSLTKSHPSALVKYFRTSAAGSAPVAANQYAETAFTNLSFTNGDKIYIQVTAPDNRTIRYYKLVVTVITTPILQSITPSADLIRFDFINLDNEKYVKLKAPEQSGDPLDTTPGLTAGWIPVVPASDGTGYAEYPLTDERYAELLREIKEGDVLYIAPTNDNGDLFDKKNLGIVGRRSTTIKDNLFFTVTSALNINGLDANTPYLVSVDRGAPDPQTRVWTTNSAGMLTMDSPQGIKNIEIQKIVGREIEEKLAIGKPVYLVTYSLNLSTNTLQPGFPTTPPARQTLSIDTRPIAYSDDAPLRNSIQFTDLYYIANWAAGSYPVVATEAPTAYIKGTSTPIENIRTHVDTITINSNLSGVDAKYIENNQILLTSRVNGPSLAATSQFLVTRTTASKPTTPVAPDFFKLTIDNPLPAAGRQTMTYNATDKILTEGMIELGVSSGYNEEIRDSYGFLVTEKSISQPMPIRKWEYSEYRFDQNAGTYRIVARSNYTTLRNIDNASRDRFGLHLVIVDGEYYYVNNDTVLEMVSNMTPNDTFDMNTMGALAAIDTTSHAGLLSLELIPGHCARTLQLRGSSNSGALLKITPSAVYAITFEIRGGNIDLSETVMGPGGAVNVVGQTANGANVTLPNGQTVTVSAQDVIIDTISSGTVGEVRLTSGASAIVLDVRVSGSNVTIQQTDTLQLTIGGAVNPTITVPASLVRANEIVLESIVMSPTFTISKANFTLDMSKLPSGSNMAFTVTQPDLSLILNPIIPPATRYLADPDGTARAIGQNETMVISPVDVSNEHVVGLANYTMIMRTSLSRISFSSNTLTLGSSTNFTMRIGSVPPPPTP